MQGFIVFDFYLRYPEAVRAIAGWIAAGELKPHEDIAEGGVEAFTPTLNRLFSGENLGKLVLKL
jgi:NADPH-dependent curcumin reductase CurA